MTLPQNLSIIDTPNATAALSQALDIRAADGVPLIVDARAPLATDLLSSTLPQTAAWAALTSGTTGAPKIVVRDARSWQVAFEPLNTQLGLSPGEGIWMPVHQVSSMALFSAAWAQVSALELVIPQRDDAGLTRAVAAHVTPAWLEHLVARVEAGEPTTIHTALVGGDYLEPALADRARAVGLRVISYVGAAELSFVAWDTGNGLRAFPGVTTSVIDDELWVASPQIALQVVGGSLRQATIDGTQWTTVGDRVTQSPDGVLMFHGRSDGAILTAGATVVPGDVETVLNQHPDVKASLVLGCPDAVLGQRVVAWIEGSAEPAALRTWARARLPKAARPVQWHKVERLPRTASGKIRRVVPEEV